MNQLWMRLSSDELYGYTVIQLYRLLTGRSRDELLNFHQIIEGVSIIASTFSGFATVSKLIAERQLLHICTWPFDPGTIALET